MCFIRYNERSIYSEFQGRIYFKANLELIKARLTEITFQHYAWKGKEYFKGSGWKIFWEYQSSRKGKVFLENIMCIRQKQSSRSEKKVKKVFLKFLQNSQENTCTGASLLIKSLLLQYRCFYVNVSTFLRTLILKYRPSSDDQKQLPEVLFKKSFQFSKISQNSQENTCARACFLIKLQTYEAFFTEHLRAAASGRLLWIRINPFALLHYRMEL